MKTSLKKLRGFATLGHERKHGRRLPQPSDELDFAAQDMEQMKDCYDRLLSAAAATANGAYEFSESLREMGECLLEKTALNDDEESGKVLLMLGKLQFQLQRLVDNYRSHIIRTIAVPSESILNELRIVEEMKMQCDGKREVYEQMMQKSKEKGGRIKGSKGECISSQQLEIACEEYDEGANVFIFRMKSLKQGQSRSLLTQAARHHAAQLSFFKKALKSLEEIEPHVKLVTEMHHIDYHFSGLDGDDEAGNENDGENDYEEDDSSDDGSESLDDGELSFDYGQNDQVYPSMELDKAQDVAVPEVATKGASKENVNRRSHGENSFSFFKDINSTKSAPLLSGKKADPAEGATTRMTSSLSSKFQPYVLPTPVEAKTPVKSPNQTRQQSSSVWHSSPLEQMQYEKQSESNINSNSGWMPPPLSSYHDSSSSNAKKMVKRQALSGPLTGKPWPKKPIVSAASTIQQQHFSLPFLHMSPKLSSSRTSPPLMSSPKISELHELPRPPPHLRPSLRQVAHSGPLVSHVSSVMNKVEAVSSSLPMPPPVLPRSYSIPSTGQKEAGALHADVVSPPLTPIALPNIQDHAAS